MPEQRQNLDAAFGFKPILDKDTGDYILRIESDPAGMEIRAFIFPKKPQRFPSPGVIAGMLRMSGVVHGLDQNAIKLACSVAATGSEQRGIVLARATLPSHGQNEKIRFIVRPNSDRYKFEVMDNNRLEGEALPLLVNVMPGEEIARTEPPTGGNPGMNVFGIPIPARDGTNMSPYPTAGEGVSWDAEAKAFFATAAGRVLFERNIISVSGSYQLTGDVNRRTGSIVFSGNIEISGNVSDNFSVKARAIKVRGRVGNTLLESEGDMTLESVEGDYSGALRCGGDLRANSLTAAFIEARGNIFVKSAIAKCVVKCGGAILASTARIEGGACTAFKGIDAHTLGNTRDAKTTIEAGRCPFVDRILRKSLRELARKERKLKRIQRMVSPYLYDPDRLAKLRPENHASYKRLNEEYKELSQELSDLKAEIDAMKNYQRTQANPVVNVRGIIMRGVTLSIGDTEQGIEMPVRSPVTIVEDSKARTLSFQKLNSNAIEAKIAALEEQDKGKPGV